MGRQRLTSTRAGRAAAVALVVGAAAWMPVARGQSPAPAATRLALPPVLQVFDAGQEVVLNGMPMRLQGFVSREPVARLVPALRRSLGEPLVVNRLGDKVVLGRADGGHYVTVQVEAAGSGSRGAIAVADLQRAQALQADSEQERRAWAQRLPPGSAVHGFMKALDGLQQSRQLIYSNRLGEAFNRDRLQAVLEREGLVLERERAVDGALDDRPGSSVTGRVLFFKGAGKNGMATINRETGGQTFVVLTLVSVLGSYR